MRPSIAGLGIALMLAMMAVSAEAQTSGQVRPIDQVRRDAIVWLEGKQNADGSWGAGRLQPITTAEVLYALAAVGRADTVVARRAVSWLEHRVHESVDSAARSVRALSGAGLDMRVDALDLLPLSVLDGSNHRGWGPTPPIQGTPPERDTYDTALALGTLRQTGLANPADPTIQEIVGFIEARQQAAFSTACQAPVSGWSGDLVPVPTDALAGDFHDLTVTAEILRGVGPLAANLGFARNAMTATCFPVDGNTPTVELAARIVAWRETGGGSAPALENALLDNGRFHTEGIAEGVWSEDPLVNAMGLLAIQRIDPSWTLPAAEDEDGDDVPNASDAFPYDPTEQFDSDGDGIGDNADRDKDGDGVIDVAWGGPDAYPDDPTRAFDVDGDGIDDGIQLQASGDADGDGVNDFAELKAGTDPFTADTDGDGVADGADPCPLDPGGVDLDGDGVCTPTDECDDPQVHADAALLVQSVGGLCDATDADGDGFDDALEIALGSDPRDASSTPDAAPLGEPGGDFDGDGLANDQEVLQGTSPVLADTDGDGVPDAEDRVLADALDPAAAPRGPAAVFGAGSADPSPGLVGPNAAASVTLGQPTPVASSGGSGLPPESAALRDAVGFQPQTLLARDLDGDGLLGWAEAIAGASHRSTDTDGDGFVDGAGGIVAATGSEWDLDGDGFVDGEADVGTDPADPGDHPGRAGDVAPAGRPDGRITAGDAVLLLRLAADPEGVLDAIELAGPNPSQNRAITEAAADAHSPQDGEIRANDAMHVLREAAEETP